MKKGKTKTLTTKEPRLAIVGLDKKRQDIIQAQTPAEFIKTRPGKGGRTFSYVSVGYVVAKLNTVFSPVGWDFEITEQIIEPTEVIVKGKLTIKDHKNGYEISKTQFGVKERQERGVTLGDTLKAAASDCLKKCASLLGVALDVYFEDLDNDKNDKPQPKVSKGTTSDQYYNIAKGIIKKETNQTVLRQHRNKIAGSNKYSEVDKASLLEFIDDKLCE